MSYQFSSKSASRMTGVHPDLVAVFFAAIRICPIDFGIPKDGGVRTAQRQSALFHDPDVKTRCDGYNTISNHQIKEGEEYGRALDVFAYINGKASWEKHHLALIAGTILSTAERMKREGKISITVRWGGTFGSDDFSGWDAVHFEAVL